MKKILVVDNSLVILRIVSLILEKMGHTVKTAENGLEALAVIETFMPDIMFIDMIMPTISGDKLCRVIRSRPELDAVFLVILSAIAAEEQLDFAGFGANACIAKGPAKEMAKHIAAVIAIAEQEGTAAVAGEILGLENLFEREITRELLETKKHFEITLANMTDGFVEITTAGVIIFANPAAVTFFEEAEEKLLSSNFFDYFTGRQRDYVVSRFAKAMDAPVEIGEEISLQLFSRYLFMKLLPVSNTQHTVIAIIHDITRRKEAEQKLLSYQTHLEDLVAMRTAEYEQANGALREALATVRQLSGFLPICASCRKIRDDKGYWSQLELYVREHTDVAFSHGICPDCASRLYPEYFPGTKG